MMATDMPITAEQWNGEITKMVATQMIHKYFTTQNIPLTKHHIDSYDQFIQRDLRNIVAAGNPLINLKEPFPNSNLYKYKIEVFIGGQDASAIRIGIPTITLKDTVRALFPNEARLRNLTYALSVTADIYYRITIRADAADASPIVHEATITDYPLCSIPLMLHSRYCVLNGKPQAVLESMGECPEDAGGYFIIDGSEKVLITKQESAFNTLYVSKKPLNPKMEYYATIQSLNPYTREVSRTSFTWTRARGLGGSADLPGDEDKVKERPSVLEVKIPQVTKPVNVFILFRALGIQTDRDIMHAIFPDFESPEAAYMADMLEPSMNAAHPFIDTYSAITYIKSLTKGFSEVHVLDIIQNELFCHIDNIPGAKAAFLAQCVRTILRIVKGVEPPTNKDDTRNQRLLTSGFLTQMLFQSIYKGWLKTVSRTLDEEYNYHKETYRGENFKNLFADGNLRLIFQAGFINNNLMKGFKGRWNTGGSTDSEIGVLQALSRLSYLDFMSHCRRVVLDFDTSMKLPGPRRLNPSQYGYFCTSETPTGAHIGVTKNLSIMTAISCGILPTKVIKWLYEYGNVYSTNDVTPKLVLNMVPVYVNGGIIGYTEEPVKLARCLRAMKRTGCLPPYSSCGFSRADRRIFIYLDEGRPLRPLFVVSSSATNEGALMDPALLIKDGVSWRDLVMGNLKATEGLQLSSTEFIDPLAEEGHKRTLETYIELLEQHMGAIEYVDPYEQNESYIANVPQHINAETTHMEIHPSTILGLLGVMIPFANHNQSPRNQLSASQSKQGLAMYATNWYNRYDNNTHTLCYGEAPLSRTLYQDYIGSGRMTYGQNIVLALAINTGYNQEDGILMNKDAIDRGLFRNMTYRSYEAFEEDDQKAKTKVRIGNPNNIPAWLSLNSALDYSMLDDNGIVKPGSVVDERTVIVGRYMQVEGGKLKDTSVTPQLWTSGRVEDVVITVNNAGLRLVKIRVVQDRTPELGDKFCLTPDHDVLTSDGWIPITDLKNTHYVATYNGTTGTLAYEQPEEIVGFAHSGPIYQINTVGDGVIRVTADHRLYVSIGNDTSKWDLVRAAEVVKQREDMYMKTDGGVIYQVKSVKIYDTNIFGDSVHCLTVSTGIFVARCHESAVGFYTGNSNRHGQKGTIGMMLRGHDMPRTAEGIVPDMIMNPHAIPSRMTIAQLLEQMLGKVAANVGAIGNATPFMNEGSPHEVLGDVLEKLGLERTGNEILYDGQSGKQIEAAIFIGPVYGMRLKHMTEDKWNARGTGRKEQRTHQPTGGRGNQGGLKIGEMERDAIVAHGVSSFVKESMMERSDGTSFIVCNGCGTIPIYNEKDNFYLCSLCDGPVQFMGDSVTTLEPVPPVKRSAVSFSKVEMPYASKLFLQELEMFLNMGIRILTSRDVDKLPASEEEVEGEIGDLEQELPAMTYPEYAVPEVVKEEPLPTVDEIRQNMTVLEEEQRRVLEEQTRVYNEMMMANTAAVPGPVLGQVPQVPGFSGSLPTQVPQVLTQVPGSIPIVQSGQILPQLSQTTPSMRPGLSKQIPQITSAVQPLEAQNMNIIPPMTENGQPTIIIDTTDAAMKAEGLVPPSQTEVVAQLPPVEHAPALAPTPKKLTRPPIKKAVVYAEPVSQTPHTGGADEYGAQEEQEGGSTSSTGNYAGMKITVQKLG